MVTWLNKLLRRQEVAQPFDTEKVVGHFLLTLPRCTNRVLVIGRSYQDKRFNYELSVDAKSLAAWATKHAEGVWSSNEPEQAARKALPLWLNGADLTDNFGSILPPAFYKILSSYHEIFTQMPEAQMYCHECRLIVENVTKKKTELPPKEIFDCWQSEWHCPQGHLLYKEEFGAHACVLRNKFPELDLNNKRQLTEPAFIRKHSQ